MCIMMCWCVHNICKFVCVCLCTKKAVRALAVRCASPGIQFGHEDLFTKKKTNNCALRGTPVNSIQNPPSISLLRNLQAAIGAYYDFESPNINAPSMSFVEDVTIGEGESVPPDTQFTKTWRIQNTGKTLQCFVCVVVCCADKGHLTAFKLHQVCVPSALWDRRGCRAVLFLEVTHISLHRTLTTASGAVILSRVYRCR